MVARLIPEATGPMDADMRAALDQRRELIEARATALTETALASGELWTRAPRHPPCDPQRYRAWFGQVRIVAAYKDRYQITAPIPLGGAIESTTQQADAVRAAPRSKTPATSPITDAETDRDRAGHRGSERHVDRSL